MSGISKEIQLKWFRMRWKQKESLEKNDSERE